MTLSTSNQERGFTLIELMVFLGLLAVVLLIATPSLNGLLERFKLDADARQLAWIYKQARQDADNCDNHQQFNNGEAVVRVGGLAGTARPA